MDCLCVCLSVPPPIWIKLYIRVYPTSVTCLQPRARASEASLALAGVAGVKASNDKIKLNNVIR